MTADSKCYDLSEHFLQDEPNLWTTKRVAELGEAIQACVEDYIRLEKTNYEPPDPPGWEGGFADNH